MIQSAILLGLINNVANYLRGGSAPTSSDFMVEGVGRSDGFFGELRLDVTYVR